MTPWYRMPEGREARSVATLERLCDALDVSRCALTLLLSTRLDGYQREIVWAALRLTDRSRAPVALAAPHPPPVE